MAVILESKSMKDLAEKYEPVLVSFMIDKIESNKEDYIDDQYEVSLDYDEVFDDTILELLEEISEEDDELFFDTQDFIEEMRGRFHFESDPRFQSIEKELYRYADELKAYHQNPWSYLGLNRANFYSV